MREVTLVGVGKVHQDYNDYKDPCSGSGLRVQAWRFACRPRKP